MLDLPLAPCYNVQKLNDKICQERGQQVSAASLGPGGLFFSLHFKGRGMPAYVHF